MSFQITALPMAPFAPLFTMSDADLRQHRAIRVTAHAKPGYPCRVSLEDAEIGEVLILVHHEHHQPAATPIRASDAVYVREDATPASPAPNEVPAMLRARPLSLRGFDAGDMLVVAELVIGEAVEAAVEEMLADASVACIHAHLAKPGCYAARIDRA